MALAFTMPAVLVVALFFAGGIGFAILQSFGSNASSGIGASAGAGASIGKLTLDAYISVFTSSDIAVGTVLSLRVSLISTIMSSIAGLLLALGCMALRSRYSRAERVIRASFAFPLGVPHLVAAYAVVLLFSQSGWLARIAYAWGWIDAMPAFPIVVNDPFGWGMIFAYVWKETPFIFLCVYPVLERIRSEWRDPARVFGANAFAFVQTVVLPLVTPVLLGASCIVFAYAFSAFEIPYVLGVTYPQVLSVLAYTLYTGELASRPEAIVVGLWLTFVPILVAAGVFFAFRRVLMRAWKGW
jgi:putative spermidine/putrescine transport system permease protein